MIGNQEIWRWKNKTRTWQNQGTKNWENHNFLIFSFPDSEFLVHALNFSRPDFRFLIPNCLIFSFPDFGFSHYQFTISIFWFLYSSRAEFFPSQISGLLFPSFLIFEISKFHFPYFVILVLLFSSFYVVFFFFPDFFKWKQRKNDKSNSWKKTILKIVYFQNRLKIVYFLKA